MTAESSQARPDFCSRLSAERGLPPIGSAGCYDAVVAFELASPWTARLTGSAASDKRLDAAIAAVAERAKRVRLLALEPAEDLRRARGNGSSRVLHFFRSGEPFPGYARRDYEVPRAGLAGALEALAGIGDEGPLPFEVEAGARDILVCTHGARDACCGKFGYSFYVGLRGLAALRGDGTRVWRTSHLGGHRFAPTLVDLPSGRIYGRLEAADAEVVLDGGARLLARLPSIYRGRCALPEPAQIVERELWLRTGPAFERRAVAVRTAEQNGTWSVHLDAGDGASLAASVAQVEVDAVVAPASCGRDPEREAPWRIVE